MSSIFGKAVAVVGLDAKGRRHFTPETLRELMLNASIEYEIWTAATPGDTTRLAREAVDQGHRYLIAVGDDWTVHEVLNGVMAEEGPIDPDLVIAVIPIARGSDFLRTMGLSIPATESVKRLHGEALFGLDAGRITWGGGGHTYFVNMAQAGLAGEISRRRERLPEAMGRVGDLLAFWVAMGRFEVPRGAVLVDRRTYGGPVVNLMVANGQFHRDGVRTAMKAHPGDGRFDVLIQKGSKRDFVATMNKALKQQHLPSPMLKEYLSARVEVTAEVPLPVEVDGKVLGTTPAIFEVVPQAFRLKI